MHDGRQLLPQALALHQRGDLDAARLAEFSTTPSDSGSSARAFHGIRIPDDPSNGLRADAIGHQNSLGGKIMLTLALRVAGRWKGRAFFALVDQGCLSLSNFLFTIVLANHVSLESFGYYSIVWTISVLAEAVTAGLVNDALPAFASTRQRSPRGDFRSAAAWANIAWGGLTSIAVAAVGITALYWSRELGAILLCMAVVNPLQRFQAFVRRLCYIEGRVDIAALNGVCYALTIFGLLGCLVPLGWLTSVTAIFVWAAASIPAVIFGIAARVSPVDVVSRAAVYEVARSLFRSGRWLLGSSLVSWVGSQGVIPLAAMVAGPAGGGVLRALFNIVAPVSVINVAINQLIVPRLAEICGPLGRPHHTQARVGCDGAVRGSGVGLFGHPCRMACPDPGVLLQERRDRLRCAVDVAVCLPSRDRIRQPGDDSGAAGDEPDARHDVGPGRRFDRVPEFGVDPAAGVRSGRDRLGICRRQRGDRYYLGPGSAEGDALNRGLRDSGLRNNSSLALTVMSCRFTPMRAAIAVCLLSKATLQVQKWSASAT